MVNTSIACSIDILSAGFISYNSQSGIESLTAISMIPGTSVGAPAAAGTSVEEQSTMPLSIMDLTGKPLRAYSSLNA